MRPLALLLVLVAALVTASCTLSTGPGERRPDTTIARLEPLAPGERGRLPYDLVAGAVGQGARRAFVVTETHASGARPAIVLLHGWGSRTMAGYEPWIAHLARAGLTVIFPVYQAPPYTDRRGFREAYPNMIAGVRAALDRVPVDRRRVAVAGVSAGGALAADYAATASRLELPAPKAVYAVYPGRAVFDGPVLLPRRRGRTAPGTLIVTVASRWDRIVGTRWARQILHDASAVPASHKRLRLVRSASLGDHGAPGRTSPAVERTFWRPLDRLLAEAGITGST
jgi:acetyl esterase/lipase